MESILTSVKKMIGVAEEYDHFDPDIVMHINSVFMILTQMGVGPAEGFLINDDVATWTDFMGNSTNIEAVKTYIALKVKLIFDPPLSSAVVEAMNRQISELEWRLHVASDKPTE